MLQIGFVGWRGLVGSVLRQQLQAHHDYSKHDWHFFSCSSAGQKSECIPQQSHTLGDAYCLESLERMDVIITTQGSSYTQRIHAKLRARSWQGYWLDSASYLRQQPSSTLILDPVNQTQIQQALNSGLRDFIGANCTVSLMLMAIAGLCKHNHIRAIQVASYQAISGAGSLAINNLLQQQQQLSKPSAHPGGLHPTLSQIDQIHNHCNQLSNHSSILTYNLCPWIDAAAEHGQSKEERKASIETAKILNQHIPIDSTCVRVPVLRAHSQALTLHLQQPLSLQSIQQQLAQAHPWVKVIDNDASSTQQQLHPQAVSGQLNIHVGRIKISPHDHKLVQMFTVGDQLLWGAAEPLRRMLNHLPTTAQRKKTHSHSTQLYQP